MTIEGQKSAQHSKLLGLGPSYTAEAGGCALQSSGRIIAPTHALVSWAAEAEGLLRAGACRH